LDRRHQNDIVITDDDERLMLQFEILFPNAMTPVLAVAIEDRTATGILSSRREFMLPLHIQMEVVQRHGNDDEDEPMQADEAEGRTDVDVLVSKPCAALTYNAALAMHALAMKTQGTLKGAGSSDRRRMFLSASRLYTVSNNLAVDNAIAMPSTWSLAIYNNLGRCYELGGAKKNAHVCFDALLKSVLIVQQGYGDDEDVLSHAECFIHNSLLRYYLKDNGLAPAA
jgi:hypothetical protein